MVCAFIVLIATSAGDATTPAHAQGSAGPGPVAEAPIFKVGEEWRWTGGNTRRVLEIDGDLIVTPYSNQQCQGCRAYRDRNLTVVKLTDNGGNAVTSTDVGYKLLDFPLKIGKKWESDQNLVNRRTGGRRTLQEHLRGRGLRRRQDQGRVFKAFRISHIQERAHSSFSSDAARNWRESFWYSPEVKALVKREVNSRIEWGPDWELESYSLK